MKIVTKSLSALKLHPRNAKVHPESQVVKIKNSLREFGQQRPLLIDEDGFILAGNGTYQAMVLLVQDGFQEFSRANCVVTTLEKAKQLAYAVADNKTAEDSFWDEGKLDELFKELQSLEMEDLISASGWSLEEFQQKFSRMPEVEGPAEKPTQSVTLRDRFLVPPFTVLDARQGYWTERKNGWLALGIKSEIGRGDNLLKFSDTILQPDEEKRKANYNPSGWDATFYPQKTAAEEKLGRELTTEEFLKDYYVQPEGVNSIGSTGTSVFDPVLCELVYRWFSAEDCYILDPFAGGSVRGIVASMLDRKYIGIDLSKIQIEENRKQADVICAEQSSKPEWINGDSLHVLSDGHIAHDSMDLIFSCPPYFDLEQYSTDEKDLSAMTWEDFCVAYREIISRACDRLKNNRFACFVVGDIRDADGNSRDFVGVTKQAFLDAGLTIYNEAVLVPMLGTVMIRAGRQFQASRKLGSAHQHVLVFLKGDSKKAVEWVGPVDFQEPEEEPETSAGVKELTKEDLGGAF